MRVYRKSDGKLAGRMQNDCTLCCTCYPQFTVYNEKEEALFRVSKDVGCFAAMCGQTFQCCGCSCQVPTGYTIHSLAPVGGAGGMLRKQADARSKVSHEDTYNLIFPPAANEEQRVLLVATAILLDYTLHDEPPEQQSMASV